MQEFRFILLSKTLVNEFIRNLHRPEPSGYGTLPPASMNTAWGVEEIHSKIIITQSYEDPSREWKGKEGDHFIGYDVSSPDGLFNANFKTNAYGDYCETVRFYCSGYTSQLEKKYKEIVINAIRYYQRDGFKNGDYEIFQNKFKNKYGMELYEYKDKSYQEYYNDWNRKWNSNH